MSVKGAGAVKKVRVKLKNFSFQEGARLLSSLYEEDLTIFNKFVRISEEVKVLKKIYKG